MKRPLDSGLSKLRGELYRLEKALAQLSSGDNREKDRESQHLEHGLSRLTQSLAKARREGSYHKTRFDLFEVLRIQKNERIHSTLVAWLLDPEESHGLGKSFLARFFRAAFGKALPPFSRALVRREWQWQSRALRFDIVVDTDHWLLAIENKIDSDESPGQMQKYNDLLCDTGKIGKTRFLALLSPHGTRPQCRAAASISYQTIGEILSGLHPRSESDVLLRQFANHIFEDLID